MSKRGPKVGFRGTDDHRFWSRVELLENGCWRWQGVVSKWGYAVFVPNGTRAGIAAHKWAYRKYIGPIPEGLEPDHICRNRACVNPWHLEPVTHRVNVLRGQGAAAKNARKTHCPRGHPYSPENTYFIKARFGKARLCKRCNSENCRKHQSNKRKKKGSKCQTT